MTRLFRVVMKNRLTSFAGLLALAFVGCESPLARGAQTLADYQHLGPRFEIKVEQDGVYRVTYESLAAAGLRRDPVRASELSIQSQGHDVALFIEGGEDGDFGPGDSILFYGEKFRGRTLAERYGSFMNGTAGWLQVCRNCRLAGMFEEYTGQNVYWLQIGLTPGLQMETIDARPTDASRVETYQATVRREESHIWWIFELESEDSWFWDRINEPVWTQASDQTTTKTVERRYPFRLSHLATGDHRAILRVGLVSRNRAEGAPDHHTLLGLNDESDPLLDETWEGAVRREIEVSFAQSKLKEGDNLLNFTELPHAGERLVALGVPWIYFDWFEVCYSRRFVAENNELFFAAPESGRHQYRTEGLTDPQVFAFDISDPFRPRRLTNPQVAAGKSTTVTFDCDGDAGTRILVLADSAIRKPRSLSFYEPPDFRHLSEADYIIISDPLFFKQLQVLADYRRSQGLRVALVDIHDLYRQFNHGIFHPVAIRNFLAFAFANWKKPPQYVVLAGWGHWNFKGYGEFPCPPSYIPPNLAYVDPWQGEVDSTTLLATLVGDDPVPDVHIGRIPAKSPEELERYIRKVIAYESSTAQQGESKAVFVADNVPDRAGDFVATTNGLIDTYFGAESGFEVQKILLNDLGCGKAKTPECEKVKDAIIAALNSGQVLLLNFLGHATIGAWTHETVLEATDVSRLNPGRRLPVLLSMTCLDGYWYHPSEPSLVRELMFSPGGIIAAFAPSGMGLTGGHDALHRGFFDALFKKGIWELGPAIMEARRRLYESGTNYDLLYTYTLFGDPALRISKPRVKASQVERAARTK